MMSSLGSTPTNNNFRVFRIPELVDLIAVYLDSKSRVQLLRTCKHVFKLVIPLVWMYVSGVRHLLPLVDGTILRANEENESEFEQIVRFSSISYTNMISHLSRTFAGV